jgi:hypothetical protein
MVRLEKSNKVLLRKPPNKAAKGVSMKDWQSNNIKGHNKKNKVKKQMMYNRNRGRGNRIVKERRANAPFKGGFLKPPAMPVDYYLEN